MSNIKLVSAEGESFTIQNILDDMENCDNAVFPLANIKSATLRKIIEWADYHKNDPQPSNEDENEEYSFTKVRTVNISPWDAQFINVDIEDLVNLIASAQYLNIKHLLHISCRTFANMIKGKTVHEMSVFLRGGNA
uniref:SKP1 component POZ domain-containing protein n=1 Tax=Glossina brevipalpis TaxID=37001 RepID=A0A1A9W5V6_9MUSC